MYWLEPPPQGILTSTAIVVLRSDNNIQFYVEMWKTGLHYPCYTCLSGVFRDSFWLFY